MKFFGDRINGDNTVIGYDPQDNNRLKGSIDKVTFFDLSVAGVPPDIMRRVLNIPVNTVDELAGKANATHQHDDLLKAPAKNGEAGAVLSLNSDGTTLWKLISVSGLSPAQEQKIANLPANTINELANKANNTHSHTTGNITGLDTALAGKAPSIHDHTISQITDMPTEFPPAEHSHSWDGITGKPETFANLAENHSVEIGFDNVPTMTEGEDESGNPTQDKPFQAFVVGCGNSYGSHAILYGDGNENTLGFVTVLGSNNKTYQFQHIVGDLNEFAEAVNVTVFGSNNKGNAKARGAFVAGTMNQINTENVTAIGHALTIGARDATVIGKHGELADAPENEGAFAVAGGALNAPKIGLIHRVNKAVANPLYNPAKDTGNTGTDSDGERQYLPEQAFSTEYRGQLRATSCTVTIIGAQTVMLDADQYSRWMMVGTGTATLSLANWTDGCRGEIVIDTTNITPVFPAEWDMSADITTTPGLFVLEIAMINYKIFCGVKYPISANSGSGGNIPENIIWTEIPFTPNVTILPENGAYQILNLSDNCGIVDPTLSEANPFLMLDIRLNTFYAGIGKKYRYASSGIIRAGWEYHSLLQRTIRYPVIEVC